MTNASRTAYPKAEEMDLPVFMGGDHMSRLDEPKHCTIYRRNVADEIDLNEIGAVVHCVFGDYDDNTSSFDNNEIELIVGIKIADIERYVILWTGGETSEIMKKEELEQGFSQTTITNTWVNGDMVDTGTDPDWS